MHIGLAFMLLSLVLAYEIMSTHLTRRQLSIATMQINEGLRQPLRTPISVWNRLCKELRFDDRVLFHIAGIRWLP